MFKVGDVVECVHGALWQSWHREQDKIKAKKLGKKTHIGNAAAYLHLHESYMVVAVTESGGIKLYGFMLQVGAADLRDSNLPLNHNHIPPVTA